MDLTKDDFTNICMIIGMKEATLPDVGKAAVALAGYYSISSDVEKAEFMRTSKIAADQVITRLQLLIENMDAELTRVEGKH